MVKAIIAAEKLVGNDLEGDLSAAIAAVYPDAAKLTISELEHASGKFKYRAILRYVAGNSGPMRGVPFLSSIIPVFAEYSSFVHGGPWADLEIETYATPKALKQCTEKAGLAFMMNASVFMFTAMAMSREYPSVAHLVPRVKAVLDKFTAREDTASTAEEGESESTETDFVDDGDPSE